MSLSPILPGRIPNSLLYTRSLDNLQTNMRLFQQLQDQISTGFQFQNIGESPVAAIKTMMLQQTMERRTQLAANVEVNRSLLSASEDSLSKIGDVFNQMKSFVLAGLGDSTSPAEKQQMATEVRTLIQQVTNLSNTKHRGRYLFGGSANNSQPFSTSTHSNAIRYNGNLSDIESYVAQGGLMANNVNVAETLKPFAEVNGSDLNPALTPQTKIASLFGGEGVKLGVIEVTIDTGGGPQTERVDLTTANTIADLVTRLEAPFGGDLSVSVGTNGLQLTPAAGTVAVSDLPNGKVAAHLGLRSPAVAMLNSADWNPGLTLQTSLASLNGGTGIGATAGNGLTIMNGAKTSTIDLNGLSTVEDLFNAIQVADADVMTGFTEDGQGLKIVSRLSGVGFSIGENNGQNAAGLGIRTLTAATPLSALHGGRGVPVEEPGGLELTRRDGSKVTISLSGAKTIQHVLDRINAEDPGVLIASLNTVGNGITLQDQSGTGALVVQENAVSVALSMVGEDDGNADLQGTDIGATATTNLLSALNGGTGIPVGGDTLNITRRDGSTESISLAGAVTVQDVLDLVNAVDPGQLEMTFSAASGGFRLNDQSGTGDLTVEENSLSTALGIDGSEPGVAGVSGGDPNQTRAGGVLDLLFRLEQALSTGNNQELEKIDQLLNAELEDFNFQRGVVALKLKSLDGYATALSDENILLEESIVNVYHTDMTLAITQYANLQVTIQASQQIAVQTLQMNLFNYL